MRVLRSIWHSDRTVPGALASCSASRHRRDRGACIQHQPTVYRHYDVAQDLRWERKNGQAPGIQRNNRIGSTQNQQSLEQYPCEQEQQMSEEQSLEISCNLPVCLHTPDFYTDVKSPLLF